MRSRVAARRILRQQGFAVKCYSHRESDAVGVCRHCARGLCGACARDYGEGLVCSEACAARLRGRVGSLAKSPVMERFTAFAAPKAPPRPRGPSLYARACAWQVRPFRYLLYAACAIGIAAIGALAMS